MNNINYAIDWPIITLIRPLKTLNESFLQVFAGFLQFLCLIPSLGVFVKDSTTSEVIKDSMVPTMQSRMPCVMILLPAPLKSQCWDSNMGTEAAQQMVVLIIPAKPQPEIRRFL